MINEHTRLEATCRRMKFEVIKAMGLFWLIEKTPGIRIKEPWRKLYKRAKQLGQEYSYSYTAIRQLQDECKLTDEQLKEVVRLANEGRIPLSSISSVLLGFKNSH